MRLSEKAVPGLDILPDSDTGGDMRSSGLRLLSLAGLGTDGLAGLRALPGDGVRGVEPPGDGIRGAMSPPGPPLIGMDLSMEFNFSAAALDMSLASFLDRFIMRRLPWI